MVSRPIPAVRPKPWGPGEWELVEASWDRWNAVFHHAAGEWRSTWLLWTPEWEFLGWYVNLQEPIWQTRWGFDSRDLQLDIVVAPDGGWRWKDEHDLVRSRETGLISRENESKVRASGAEAIRLIERGFPPFDAGAKEWRPPPGWANLTLPDVLAEIELRTWSPEDALGRFE